jgi:hypothetical protein
LSPPMQALLGRYARDSFYDEFADDVGVPSIQHRVVIAEPVIPLSCHPTVVGDGLAPRHIDLRPLRALRSGSRRAGLRAHARCLTDTWILDGDSAALHRKNPMLSRIADRPESLHVVNTRCAHRLRLTIRCSPAAALGQRSRSVAGSDRKYVCTPFVSRTESIPCTKTKGAWPKSGGGRPRLPEHPEQAPGADEAMTLVRNFVAESLLFA